MPVREIPRDQWSSFLESFSRRHDGWLCTLAVSDRASVLHDEAVDKPLVGIAADHERRGERVISILLGGTAQDHLSYVVPAPTRMRLAQTAEGADETLEIEARDGTAVLAFRSAILPELVDGISTSPI